MKGFLREIKARAKYNMLCIFFVDKSWDMGAHLTGSALPMGGFWINEKGSFKYYEDAVKDA